MSPALVQRDEEKNINGVAASEEDGERGEREQSKNVCAHGHVSASWSRVLGQPVCSEVVEVWHRARVLP